MNFCVDGQHPFGQGVVTYAQGDIVNWITTLSDSFRLVLWCTKKFYACLRQHFFCCFFRVADDLGKLRFQLSYFHKPLFGWKGSFVVTQVSAERKVGFDHGLEGLCSRACSLSYIAFTLAILGSIAEDCFFSMIAYRDKYTFNFIEGESATRFGDQRAHGSKNCTSKLEIVSQIRLK